MEHFTHDTENFVFGEVPVSAPPAATRRASPDELVEMAGRIWTKVKNSGIAEEDSKGNDDLLKKLQDEFKDFNESFPVALRWMVQARKFSSQAFRKYLLKHAKTKLDTREAFIRLQGEYLPLLFEDGLIHPDKGRVA